MSMSLKLRTLLHPTDFSPCAGRALDQAALFAGQLEAEIHLLHAVTLRSEGNADPRWLFGDPEPIFQRLESRAESELARLAESLRARGVAARATARRAVIPAALIREFAAEIGADLVVIGREGQRPSEPGRLGAVADEVVRFAERPVMTVPDRFKGEALPRQILAPVDFSAGARAAAGYAHELAAALGASLLLLHVFETSPLPDVYSGAVASIWREEPEALRDRTLAALERLVRELPGPEVPWQGHLARGKSGPAITAFAEEHDAALIVLASHGLAGWRRLLLGTTAEAVVRTAPCPVVTVRAPS